MTALAARLAILSTIEQDQERRTTERRVSPAISTFAILECARLRTVNAELVAILRDWRATELDAMDEEFEPWMAAFTARVAAAIARATVPA